MSLVDRASPEQKKYMGAYDGSTGALAKDVQSDYISTTKKPYKVHKAESRLTVDQGIANMEIRGSVSHNGANPD